tara:strand:- start:717 stop:896 length:180 start_codon:yes stop_codon:yes gene_type:complete
MGNEMFVIKRTFKGERFEKVMAKFPSKEICAAYHCEKILKGRDGLFYLCDKVDDAVIIK